MGSLKTQETIEMISKYAANNYGELPPIAINRAAGPWVWDNKLQKYLDFMSSYAVTNFGHQHPGLVWVLEQQLNTLPVCSRAFANKTFAIFCRDLASFCGMDKVLPAVDGSGAIERAIKIVRKWACKNNKKSARILCFHNNFHGRTYGPLSMSDNPRYQDGFWPFLNDFTLLPFGDISAFERIVSNSKPTMWSDGYDIAAVFIEPIQGEGGVRVPPDGYLRQVREFCTENNVLMVADEIQTGFGRTGFDLACQYEDVQPDIYVIGKALGGGLLPISAVVTTEEIMKVIGPGDDGSTFGGYPLGCAVAIEAIRVLQEEKLSENSRVLGKYFMEELKKAAGECVLEVRGRGLMIGIQLKNGDIAKRAQLKLLENGILCGLSRDVLRINPPLIIKREHIDWALPIIRKVIEEVSR